MQTNPAVEHSKIIRWPESPWSQSARKEKGQVPADCGRKCVVCF